MTEIRIGDQTIRFDHGATVASYEKIQQGEAESCGCKSCRNFLGQRATVFPPDFIALLQELGIDPTKEAEVYDASCRPLEDGCHLYGGWYGLVGEIVTSGERNCVVPGPPHFEYFFTTAGHPQAAFNDRPRIFLEFTAHVKWLLAEPPDEYR